MVVRKGLSKAFTKEVVSEDTLAPSDFKVVPIKLTRSYADSPIDEIRKQKEMETSSGEDKAAEERLKKARTPTEKVLDREKIDRVVKRINMLKKMRLEQEKQQEAAAKAQKQAAEQAEKARLQAQKVSPAPQPSSTGKSTTPQKEGIPAEKQENIPQVNKGGFIQRINIFKSQQADKPKQQESPVKAAQNTGTAPKPSSPEKSSVIAHNTGASEKKQGNNPPVNKGSETKKPDSSTKNNKDNSVKESSF